MSEALQTSDSKPEIRGDLLAARERAWRRLAAAGTWWSGAERVAIAAELRAQGAENAERIRAEADRERTVLLAEAYRDAEILRGEGDATAAEIYAKAYDKDRDFYSFHRSIQAYRRAIGQQGDLLVLDSKGEFFRYLNQADDKD